MTPSSRPLLTAHPPTPLMASSQLSTIARDGPRPRPLPRQGGHRKRAPRDDEDGDRPPPAATAAPRLPPRPPPTPSRKEAYAAGRYCCGHGPAGSRSYAAGWARGDRSGRGRARDGSYPGRGPPGRGGVVADAAWSTAVRMRPAGRGGIAADAARPGAGGSLRTRPGRQRIVRGRPGAT